MFINTQPQNHSTLTQIAPKNAQIITQRDGNIFQKTQKSKKINKTNSPLNPLQLHYTSSMATQDTADVTPKGNLAAQAGQNLFNSKIYEQYFSSKNSPLKEKAKKKRSYYWKINELAILFMVSFIVFIVPFDGFGWF